MNDIAEVVTKQAQEARRASQVLRRASTHQKNRALNLMAQKLRSRRTEIEEVNRQDREAARQEGLSKNLLDRLVFDAHKVEARAAALGKIEQLPDPVGEADYLIKRPGGLLVKRVRVPLGVVGMIFEARPHVTVNAGALCLKSGNAALLRGGSEALRTNMFLGDLWEEALEEADLPQQSVQVIRTDDRRAVDTMISLEEYIDVLIPRGGKGLVRLIKEKSLVPVIKHYEGICHVYLDKGALPEEAVSITYNSKVFMPEVCNALETLLVHRDAVSLLPAVADSLKEAGVKFRACPRAKEYLPEAEEAQEADWTTEYLDLVLAVKVVDSLEDAIEHINTYGSHHTDVIVSRDYYAIRRFEEEVDSGVVLVNASTMFNDGGELGMGAEIGISTDKLHARGPVGMRDLTSYKYVVEGQGHVM